MKNYTVYENGTLSVPKPLKNKAIKAINVKNANLTKIKRITGK